jgi:DNA invertase Pin-like site-specific DNA recombinase
MSKRVRPGSPLLAIAYLRVSTDDQALGPEAQRAAIEAWAARAGVTVASWHVDAGVSGAAPIEEREALSAALAGLREHGAGLLLVAKRDRIARDPYVACAVERAAESAGARLVSADGTGNGDGAADVFMRRILDGAAEYERALIRARTRAALGVKRARGERVGAVPFGLRLAVDGVHLEPEPEEQATITRARELRAAGWSLRDVAAALEEEGRRSRAGRAFAPTQIARMLVA